MRDPHNFELAAGAFFSHGQHNCCLVCLTAETLVHSHLPARRKIRPIQINRSKKGGTSNESYLRRGTSLHLWTAKAQRTGSGETRWPPRRAHICSNTLITPLNGIRGGPKRSTRHGARTSLCFCRSGTRRATGATLWLTSRSRTLRSRE